MKAINLSVDFKEYATKFYEEHIDVLAGAKELLKKGITGEEIVTLLYSNYHYIYEALLKEFNLHSLNSLFIDSNDPIAFELLSAI